MGQRIEQPGPDPGMGEPAEMAGDGIRLAEAFRQQGEHHRDGGVEDGIHAGAEFQRAAGGGSVLEEGAEGGPFSV